jgi:hypothetical protein
MGPVPFVFIRIEALPKNIVTARAIVTI